MRTGDIVKLLSSNERKLIVETRDEIIPSGAGLRLRIMYRLAGDKQMVFAAGNGSLDPTQTPLTLSLHSTLDTDPPVWYIIGVSKESCKNIH